MFFHPAGIKTLWPELVLLPWLALGAFYLLSAMLHGRKAEHHPHSHLRS